MTLLYPWVLFFLIPSYILYKNETIEIEQTKKRQKNLIYLALFFTLLALSRPVIIQAPNEQKFDAQDYIIALDASYSMQADDLQPSRYEVAKKNISHIIKSLNKDRFSIFAFTSNAMLLSPPTTDSAISMMALNALEPQYILTKGTSLLSLFTTIAKTSYQQKNLIIFTDGGEDRDLVALVNLCKNNSTTPYIVATGSSSGTLLKKNDKPMIDSNKNLVISKINPLLQPLAKECGGKYYQLDTTKDIAEKIIADIQKHHNAIQSTTKVFSYKELFIYPLFLALLSFFVSVTKLHQLFLSIPLLFLPLLGHSASLFDFYHYKKANQAYKSNQFITAAKEFQKLSPSPQSYYNSAVAYYKAKNYKKSIELFSQIKSTNPKLKQNIFYNLGNCAVALQKYDRAKYYYQNALALGFDEDTYHNLLLLYKHKLLEQKDPSHIFSKKSTKKETMTKKRETKHKDVSKSATAKSNQKASQKSNGSGTNSKKKKQNQEMQLVKQQTQSNYKLGYKAYELINKGYTNEKHPW